MSFNENFTCDNQPVFGRNMNFDFPAYETSIDINIPNGGIFNNQINNMYSNGSTEPDYEMTENNFQGEFMEEALGISNDFINNKKQHTNKVPSQKPQKPHKPQKHRKFKDSTEDDGYGFFKHMFTEDDNCDGDSDDGNDGDECNNPLCDHKDYQKGEKRIDHTQNTPVSVNDVSDLIKLGRTYHCKKNKIYYGINLRILSNLVPPLTQLENLVGMRSVKQNLVNQVVFFLQGFNQKEKCGNCVDCSYNLPCPKNLSNDMLHTVITGPPGVGKTELGKILGKVYKSMGVLSKGHVKVVSRSDLIGKYLGHTAAKTQAAIDECIGGVMFIDV